VSITYYMLQTFFKVI